MFGEGDKLGCSCSVLSAFPWAHGCRMSAQDGLEEDWSESPPLGRTIEGHLPFLLPSLGSFVSLLGTQI
jgi:hypothetical protein